MRSFNTTAVNLRATLDDLDPLVDASKPVAKKLQPFTALLRGFARDAVPTVKDLDSVVRRRGRDNDLVELTRLQVPLSKIAVGPVNRNGKSRQGAFAESVDSLNGALPQLAFFRPYTPELTGWFDDFSHTGPWDANGGMARQSIIFNAFTLDPTTGLPQSFIPFADRGEVFKQLASTFNDQRCPGSNERDRDGSIPFTDPGGQPSGTSLDCDTSQEAVGPVNRNGKSRQGAFAESKESLVRSLPQLAFFRPYVTNEALSGWFDDFGHSGIQDANGGIGRIATTFNVFSLSAGVPNLLAPPITSLSGLTSAGLTTDQLRRCPGANERNPGDNSTPFTDNGTLNCDPSQVPPGP